MVDSGLLGGDLLVVGGRGGRGRDTLFSRGDVTVGAGGRTHVCTGPAGPTETSLETRMSTIELARFTVRPENAEEMLERRPALARTLREQFPGFLSLALVRLDERTWLDVVEWSDRSGAEAAQEAIMGNPDCRAFLELIDEVVAMEHGEVAQHVQRERVDA